jgi:hypothetical protein
MTNPNVTLLTPLGADSLDQSLFARVEQALLTLPGPWKVGLSHGEAMGWFVLTVFRDDGFECTLLLEGPLQQTSGHIRDRLADALQRHMVGASRPRKDETRH